MSVQSADCPTALWVLRTHAENPFGYITCHWRNVKRHLARNVCQAGRDASIFC